jgi:P pilus assembly chaperone PapD
VFHRRIALLAALSLSLAAAPPVRAQQGADLNISPKRVVFDATTRTATVFVFNRGTEAASYAIGVDERAMLEDGRILAVADAAAMAEGAAPAAVAAKSAATPMITFTPRRVTLQPGQSQAIRVRVLRPADLADGEYRAHLAVSTLPPEDAGLTADEAAATADGRLAVRIVSLFSLSIPLIVRQGDAGASAELADARTVTEQRRAADGSPELVPHLALDVRRAGAGSVYGTLEVRSERDGRGAEPLGAVRGLGVYPEIGLRHVRLPLRRAPVSGERLTLTYVDEDRSPGRVIASTTFVAP